MSKYTFLILMMNISYIRFHESAWKIEKILISRDKSFDAIHKNAIQHI